jgi:hypothetical protein
MNPELAAQVRRMMTATSTAGISNRSAYQRALRAGTAADGKRVVSGADAEKVNGQQLLQNNSGMLNHSTAELLALQNNEGSLAGASDSCATTFEGGNCSCRFQCGNQCVLVELCVAVLYQQSRELASKNVCPANE